MYKIRDEAKKYMDQPTLKSALIKIELVWSTTSKEKSDDPRSYEYIASQSIALKNEVMNLKSEIGASMGQKKKDKLKYQKLYNSLSQILETLDFESTPCKDSNYIQDILDKLKKVDLQINTLIEYQ